MGIAYTELCALTEELTVLFVEDYQPFVDEMREILSELFKEVVIAADGEEALNKYVRYGQKNNKNFDIVLTDIRLPKLNGVELSKAIYAMHSAQNIIVISSYTETEDLLELLNMGIRRFIKKPINYDELCDALYHVCYSCQKLKKELVLDSPIISIGHGYTWDRVKKVLGLNHREVYCTLYELILLESLTRHIGMVCTVEMLIGYYKDHDIDITAKSIRNLVLKIRQKTYKECIQNIYGLGYCIQGT